MGLIQVLSWHPQWCKLSTQSSPGPRTVSGQSALRSEWCGIRNSHQIVVVYQITVVHLFAVAHQIAVVYQIVVVNQSLWSTWSLWPTWLSQLNVSRTLVARMNSSMGLAPKQQLACGLSLASF